MHILRFKYFLPKKKKCDAFVFFIFILRPTGKIRIMQSAILKNMTILKVPTSSLTFKTLEESRARLLNLNTVDVLGQISLRCMGGSPMHHRTFSRIFGLYSLEDNSTHLPAVITKNVFKHCQTLLWIRRWGGRVRNCPQLRAADPLSMWKRQTNSRHKFSKSHVQRRTTHPAEDFTWCPKERSKERLASREGKRRASQCQRGAER